MNKLKTVLPILAMLTLSAWCQEIAVEVNGRKVDFSTAPATVEGRLVVPLKEMLEALDAEVTYHEPTASFRAQRGDKVLQVLVDRRTAIVDGNPVFLKVPASRRGDTVFIPLRFVCESLEAPMQWDQETKTAHLSPTAVRTVRGPSEAPVLVVGPQLDRVIHSGTTVMKPGQVLEVVAFGDPGCQASFSIADRVRDVPLPEISAGRYQTRYTLPPSLEIENGLITARLRVSERSVSAVAPGSLTVRKERSETNDLIWSVTPEKDAMLEVTRPEFTAKFPDKIDPQSFRFRLDGLEFTSLVQVTESSFLWRPSYDLSSGPHQAAIEAKTVSGKPLQFSWSFQVQR